MLTTIMSPDCPTSPTASACLHATLVRATSLPATDTANSTATEISTSWWTEWGSWDAAVSTVSAHPVFFVYLVAAVALVLLLLFTLVRSGPELIKRLLILATCIVLWFWLFPSFGAGRWVLW